MDMKKFYGFLFLVQVQEKLREVGLESSNLIVGVDFTKSNEWTGQPSLLLSPTPGRLTDLL